MRREGCAFEPDELRIRFYLEVVPGKILCLDLTSTRVPASGDEVLVGDGKTVNELCTVRTRRWFLFAGLPGGGNRDVDVDLCWKRDVRLAYSEVEILLQIGWK